MFFVIRLVLLDALAYLKAFNVLHNLEWNMFVFPLFHFYYNFNEEVPHISPCSLLSSFLSPIHPHVPFHSSILSNFAWKELNKPLGNILLRKIILCWNCFPSNQTETQTQFCPFRAENWFNIEYFSFSDKGQSEMNW